MLDFERRHSVGLTAVTMALAMLFSAACGRGTGGGPDTTGGGGVTPPVGPGKSTGLRGRPGADLPATRDYLLSLGWGDNLTDSQIVAHYNYPLPGNDSARVRVVPMLNAQEISWQNALMPDSAGHFVAKIYNEDNKPITKLGLSGLGTGYVWVGQVGNTAAERGIAVYSIKNNGQLEGTPRVWQEWGYCSDDPHSFPKVAVGAKKCALVAKKNVAGASMFMFTRQPPPTGVNLGLWISCSGGCCEIEFI